MSARQTRYWLQIENDRGGWTTISGSLQYEELVADAELFHSRGYCVRIKRGGRAVIQEFLTDDHLGYREVGLPL